MKAGWQSKALGDICDVIGGGTPSKANPDFYIGDIPWATVRDMRSERIAETEFKISKSACINSSTNVISKGNVVIATRVGLGKVCLLEQDTAINQDLKGIIPKDKNLLDVNFLFSWLKSVSQQIIDEGTGATVQGVKLPFIKSLKIPVPSIQEQQRIVAILDKAFEQIAIARANTEINLQNARALFKSYLQKVFTQRGEEWREGVIEEYVDKNCSLSYGVVQPGNDYENGLPIVRPTDLSKKLITLKGLKLINPDLASSYKRTQLIGDEILLCVRGETGTVSVTTPELKGANVTRGIVPIRFNRELISQKFGYWIMKSPFVQAQIKSKTYGAALLQINIGDLRKLNIAYPNLETQNSLAKTFDKLDEETQRLESLYQSKLDALDALKKSLLHQAFTGEL